MNESPSSDPRFDVGEIAIVTAAAYYMENVGQEVEVVGGLAWRLARNDRQQYYCYVIRRADGRKFLCKPNELRKKKPPSEDLHLVSWDECPWQPEKVSV